MFMKILSRSTLWLEIALLSPAHLSPLTAAAAILHFLLDFLFPSNNLPFSNFLISIYQSFIFIFFTLLLDFFLFYKTIHYFQLDFFISIQQSSIIYSIFSFLSTNSPFSTWFFHSYPTILHFPTPFFIPIQHSSLFYLIFSFLSNNPPYLLHFFISIH